MSIDLSGPVAKPTAGFGGATAWQGSSVSLSAPAPKASAGFGGGAACANPQSIDLSGPSRKATSSAGGDRAAPHQTGPQQLPSAGPAAYASKQSVPESQSASSSAASVQTLLCTQAECCFRLLALACEEGKILLGALSDIREGGVAVQRASAAADLLVLLVTCLGALELGYQATAHLVNAYTIALALLGLLIEASPPQLAAARETVLDQVHCLREPRGLAALHGVEGVLLLAVWHDHDNFTYGLASIVAAAVACLGLAGDRLGWAAGASGGGWSAVGTQGAAVVGVPL